LAAWQNLKSGITERGKKDAEQIKNQTNKPNVQVT
jgi:hypothetical protein